MITEMVGTSECTWLWWMLSNMSQKCDRNETRQEGIFISTSTQRKM